MTDQDPDRFNSLDQDVAGDVDDDGYIPPDEPMGAHAYGTTAAEERAGETFQQRTKHMIPEVDGRDPVEPVEAVGRLLQPGDEDVDAVDNEGNVVARDQGVDDDMSAEERAMHRTDV